MLLSLALPIRHDTLTHSTMVRSIPWGIRTSLKGTADTPELFLQPLFTMTLHWPGLSNWGFKCVISRLYSSHRKSIQIIPYLQRPCCFGYTIYSKIIFYCRDDKYTGIKWWTGFLVNLVVIWWIVLAPVTFFLVTFCVSFFFIDDYL